MNRELPETVRSEASSSMPECAFSVRIVKKYPASDRVVALEVVSANGDMLPEWQPGAHVDFLLPNGLARQYSLCGAPEDRERWRFGILREENSRGGSTYVHDALRQEDVIQLKGPRNNFALVNAPSYRFIAGGIGITPLLPMLRTTSARQVPWTLAYGASRRSTMAFAEELREFSNNVGLFPQDELGHLNLDVILADLANGEAVYCCGPNPLIDAVKARFDRGLRGTLHVERFTPVDSVTEAPDAEFTVFCRRTDRSIKVAAHETILEALEREGIHPPFSCREGTCGTCETRVLAGRPDHRDSVLTEDEKASNRTMTICVSRSRDALLEIDL